MYCCGRRNCCVCLRRLQNLFFQHTGLERLVKEEAPKVYSARLRNKSVGGAGIGVELMCGYEYWATLDAICIDLDIAVELCANAADTNYKKCDL